MKNSLPNLVYPTKTIGRGGLVFLFVGCLFGASTLMAGVIFSDDFSTGTTERWSRSNGTWCVIPFNGGSIVQNDPGESGSFLETSLPAVTVQTFDLSFDYGWLYGIENDGTKLGVELLDGSQNGYAFTIRQAGGPDSGYKYQLWSISGGVWTSLAVTGTEPVESGWPQPIPLARASMTWDGTVLRGIQNGNEVIHATIRTWQTFSVVRLGNIDAGGEIARFDHILLDVQK
jgi:hypothetical protein